LAARERAKSGFTIWTRLREKCERQHVWDLAACRRCPHQGLAPQSPALALPVTETSHGKVKFLGLYLFEQSRSDADFEFDFKLRILPAEAE
jgi:hypothetical protein